MTRKRPALSVTAATVTAGVRDMGKDYSRRRCDGCSALRRLLGGSAAAGGAGAQAALDLAGVPHLIELLEVQPRHYLIVDVGDAVPALGSHAIDDRPVVGDQVRGGALRRLGGGVADVDAARQPLAHGHEAVAVARSEERRVGKGVDLGGRGGIRKKKQHVGTLYEKTRDITA